MQIYLKRTVVVNFKINTPQQKYWGTLILVYQVLKPQKIPRNMPKSIVLLSITFIAISKTSNLYKINLKTNKTKINVFLIDNKIIECDGGKWLENHFL